MDITVGIDEVGRGCLAGPLLVVAARQTGRLPDGLKDSKLLSRLQRMKLLDALSNCCMFGEGWVSAAEIDEHGLSTAIRMGVERALDGLGVHEDEQIVVDGNVDYTPKKFRNVKCITGADKLVPVVSAASIHAKVTRDNFMSAIAKKYPGYNFDKHVGYGTAEHLAALNSLGGLKNIHRTSFAPIAKLRTDS